MAARGSPLPNWPPANLWACVGAYQGGRIWCALSSTQLHHMSYRHIHVHCCPPATKTLPPFTGNRATSLGPLTPPPKDTHTRTLHCTPRQKVRAHDSLPTCPAPPARAGWRQQPGCHAAHRSPYRRLRASTAVKIPPAKILVCVCVYACANERGCKHFRGLVTTQHTVLQNHGLCEQ